MKINLKDYDLECKTDCQEFRGFEVGEIVFDGKVLSGCKCVGVIMAIYTKNGLTFRLDSNGCQNNISKCPDNVAKQYLPFLKKGWLGFVTPDGKVVDYHTAFSMEKDSAFK